MSDESQIRNPEHMTNYEQLLALVPDFDQRLKQCRPELRASILDRAVKQRWSPLSYLQGCM
jgi:hypothetical protein